MLTKGDESCQADDELGTEIDFTTPVMISFRKKGRIGQLASSTQESAEARGC